MQETETESAQIPFQECFLLCLTQLLAFCSNVQHRSDEILIDFSRTWQKLFPCQEHSKLWFIVARNGSVCFISLKKNISTFSRSRVCSRKIAKLNWEQRMLEALTGRFFFVQTESPDSENLICWTANSAPWRTCHSKRPLRTKVSWNLQKNTNKFFFVAPIHSEPVALLRDERKQKFYKLFKFKSSYLQTELSGLIKWKRICC